MDTPDNHRSPADCLAFADGALGAAGHEIAAPALRALAERFVRGEITVEQALAEGHALIAAGLEGPGLRGQ